MGKDEIRWGAGARMRNREKGHSVLTYLRTYVLSWSVWAASPRFFVRSVNFALLYPAATPPPTQQVFNYERTESGHGTPVAALNVSVSMW